MENRQKEIIEFIWILIVHEERRLKHQPEQERNAEAVPNYISHEKTFKETLEEKVKSKFKIGDLDMSAAYNVLVSDGLVAIDDYRIIRSYKGEKYRSYKSYRRNILFWPRFYKIAAIVELFILVAQFVLCKN